MFTSKKIHFFPFFLLNVLYLIKEGNHQILTNNTKKDALQFRLVNGNVCFWHVTSLLLSC